MGGGAFAQASAQGEATLRICRLQPQQYNNLKSVYLQKLQDYFPEARIACLTEAPEKQDYGDIDIFIALDQRVDFHDMAAHLGAAGLICHSAGSVQKCSVAVPMHGSAHDHPPVTYTTVHSTTVDSANAPSKFLTDEEYAQIDIEIIIPDLCEWYIFYSSYGDMVGLLGHIVTNLGFTVSDRGFWLRMQELDDSKDQPNAGIADREGKILLSTDPVQVMRFLGLSIDAYHEGFQTIQELYEWLGQSRMLSAHAIKLKRNNSHERNREQKRPIFSRFFNEWLPSHLDLESVDPDQQTQIVRNLREDYRAQAIDFFDKTTAYEQTHRLLVSKLDNAKAADLLRPILARCSGKSGKSLNEILRGFRRYVGFTEEGEPIVAEMPHSDIEAQLFRFLGADKASLLDVPATERWVEQHWEEVRGLERQRLKACGDGTEA